MNHVFVLNSSSVKRAIFNHRCGRFLVYGSNNKYYSEILKETN